jgi:hypothetical protein
MCRLKVAFAINPKRIFGFILVFIDKSRVVASGGIVGFGSVVFSLSRRAFIIQEIAKKIVHERSEISL